MNSSLVELFSFCYLKTKMVGSSRISSSVIWFIKVSVFLYCFGQHLSFYIFVIYFHNRWKSSHFRQQKFELSKFDHMQGMMFSVYNVWCSFYNLKCSSSETLLAMPLWNSCFFHYLKYLKLSEKLYNIYFAESVLRKTIHDRSILKWMFLKSYT